MPEELLSDRKAVQLTELLKAYFVDCVREDPTSTHPGNLSVRELIEDLAASTNLREQAQIEELLDEILGLYA